MRQLKFPALLLLTTFAALVSSASADPTGSFYNLRLQNLPVDYDSQARNQQLIFQLGDTSLDLGTDARADVAGRSTNVAQDRELIEYFLETLFPTDLAEDANLPGSLSLSDLNWGGQEGRVLADTGFYYFTINGVPQRMTDQGGLGVQFGVHPLVPTTQVVLMNNPGSAFSDSVDFHWSSEDVSNGLTMGQLLTGLGLDPSNINDLHIGFNVSHLIPEPSALSLLGMGSVLALRRRRTRRQA